MSMQRSWRIVNSTVTLAFLAAAILNSAFAQEKTLTAFYAGYRGKLGPGAAPYGGLVRDASGNLYGTTNQGGFYAGGTAYELIAAQNYTAKVLHSFGGRGDGYFSYASLLLDDFGNLYGTTSYGGLYSWGTVFELTRTSGADWTEKILHSFTADEGAFPFGSLIMDGSGNLYGTTEGNAYSTTDFGSVFELQRTSGGWAFRTLHRFRGPDGRLPTASLVFDPTGNLYGTTQLGGLYDGGTVFELSPISGGKWAEKVLHIFNSANNQDGCVPKSGLTFDAAGNLYGTTGKCGEDYSHYGTVFELTPDANGSWTETIIHTFLLEEPDGWSPSAGVVFDRAGNLYGTTDYGGTDSGGSIFKLVPQANGAWEEQLVYSFHKSNGGDYFPHGGLVLDAAGNLYGTAVSGGAGNGGTVFMITP